MVFSEYVGQGAEKRTEVALVRVYSALATIGHAASKRVSESVVVTGAHACCRGTRARLHGTEQGSPSHAGGEQCDNGQNGQKPDRKAHVFCLEAQSTIITDLERSGTILT